MQDELPVGGVEGRKHSQASDLIMSGPVFTSNTPGCQTVLYVSDVTLSYALDELRVQ